MAINIQQHQIDRVEWVSIRNEGAANTQATYLHFEDVPEFIEQLAALRPATDPNQLTLFDQDEYLVDG